nr:DUF6048 family protein [Lacinutrix neustonica]
MKHTGLYVISSLILLCGLTVNAQDKKTTVTDSIKYTQKYGLRVGADLSKLIRTAIDEDYKGFELNGDFRLTQSWYIAAELGNEEKTSTTDFLNVTASEVTLKAA